MKTKLIFLALFFAIACPLCADPPIKVVISKGYKKRPVLAFPRFYVETDAAGIPGAGEMNELFFGDLKLSGQVSLLAQSGAVNKVGSEETFEKTDYRSWRLSGTEFLVKVKLASRLGAPEIAFSLHDITNGREITNNRRRGSAKALRELGHRVSDEILIALTGKPGIGQSRIAFVSDQGGNKTIYSSDLQGKDIQQHVFTKAMVLTPHWGPRRDTLLYTSYQDVNPRIFMKEMRSNKVEPIASFPGLNVNGRINHKNEVVFTASRDGNPEIYKVNTLTRQFTRLTRHQGVDATPCWSPDGNRIAFVSEMQGSPQIFTMNASGAELKRLTYTQTHNSSPAWSPDGRYLAFSTRIQRLNQLAIYDFQENRTQILVANMRNAEGPSFAPNSQFIAFASEQSGTWQIYVIDMETGEIIQITRGFGNCTNPSWG